MSTEQIPQQRPGIPTDTLGIRLRIARAHAGDISIEKAAEMCDLKPATWSTWERGVHNPPHRAAIVAIIAAKLGVDYDWLLDGGPLSPEPPSGGPPKPVTLGENPSAKRPGKARTRRNSVYSSATLGTVAA